MARSWTATLGEGGPLGREETFDTKEAEGTRSVSPFSLSWVVIGVGFRLCVGGGLRGGREGVGRAGPCHAPRRLTTREELLRTRGIRPNLG